MWEIYPHLLEKRVFWNEIYLSINFIHFRARGLSDGGDRHKTKTETAQTQKEIAQVSVTEAKKALENKKDAQFIDVRTVEEYAGSHAVGARNLPLID